MHALSITTQNSQNLEAAQMPITDEWIPDKGILFSLEGLKL